MAIVAYGVHCQATAILETVVRSDGFIGCFATALTSELFDLIVQFHFIFSSFSPRWNKICLAYGDFDLGKKFFF